VNVLLNRSPLKSNEIVGRVLNGERGTTAGHEAIDFGRVRGVNTRDTVSAEGIVPDFSPLKSAMRKQLLAHFRSQVQPGKRVVFHRLGCLPYNRSVLNPTGLRNAAEGVPYRQLRMRKLLFRPSLRGGSDRSER
jgi:hypothetical protein